MKIKEFYLDRARYKAVDENGHMIFVDINYWDGSYKLTSPNEVLARNAEKLLKKKHKVNFVGKLLK